MAKTGSTAAAAQVDHLFENGKTMGRLAELPLGNSFWETRKVEGIATLVRLVIRNKAGYAARLIPIEELPEYKQLASARRCTHNLPSSTS